MGDLLRMQRDRKGVTRTVHVPDSKVPNRGVKDAGAEAPDLGKRVANFIAIPSGIAVFIFTFSLVQNNTLGIAAIVAAVVYAALYWTLSRPLYGLSSGIGAVVSTAFEILGLVLRVAIYLVGAGVIVWIAWALLR